MVATVTAIYGTAQYGNSEYGVILQDVEFNAFLLIEAGEQIYKLNASEDPDPDYNLSSRSSADDVDYGFTSDKLE